MRNKEILRNCHRMEETKELGQLREGAKEGRWEEKSETVKAFLSHSQKGVQAKISFPISSYLFA
jgi:hypothetical protein